MKSWRSLSLIARLYALRSLMVAGMCAVATTVWFIADNVSSQLAWVGRNHLP